MKFYRGVAWGLLGAVPIWIGLMVIVYLILR